jgi:hypothetical protein
VAKEKRKSTAKSGLAPSSVPCLRVVVGGKPGKTGQTDAQSCAVVGENRGGEGGWDLGREYRSTSKTVDAVDGKNCGTTTVKSGKDKGKVKTKKCPLPCAGALKRKGCPAQLAFDKGQPFLRFCATEKTAGYQVKVNTPAEATRVAKDACDSWRKHGHAVPMPPRKGKPQPDRWVGTFEHHFPAGTPLRGTSSKKGK